MDTSSSSNIWWVDDEPDPSPHTTSNMSLITGSFSHAFTEAAKACMELEKAFARDRALGRQDFVLFPPARIEKIEPPEDPRARALRLKSRPHSMTTRRGFDRKGRKS